MSKGEETRQKIVQLAMPLFNQSGFEGTSLQDIMQATEMEKGGIYRHFSSKEEIAVASFRFALTLTRKTRTAHLAEIDGALPKLRRAIQDFVETPSPVPGGCPLMNTAVDADDGNPALRALVTQAFRDWRKRLMEIIRKGQVAGEIRSSVSSRQIANTIIAALEGALVMCRLEQNKQPLHDARSSLELVLDSIAVIEPAHARN